MQCAGKHRRTQGWAKASTIIVGNRESTSPALKTSQLIPAFEMKGFSATGTVIFSSEKMNIDARNSSFQIFTKNSRSLSGNLDIEHIARKRTFNIAHKKIS